MIVIKKSNHKELKEAIDNKLSQFNREKCQWLRNNSSIDQKEYEENEHNFFVYVNDKLVGGAIGYIKYNWYFLDLLYIDDEYRGQDIGTELINRIEKLARKEKLVGIRMETWDFQARGFYEKNGYIVYAEIKDCPPGTIDYFLKKEI